MNTAHPLSRLSALFVLAILGAAGAAGQTPQEFNYQGRITDATGQPFATGSYCFSFGLWDDPSGGGTRVWGDEIVQDVYVIDGYFNVILGAGVPLAGKFHEAERYLAVKVGADCATLGAEILPRQKVLSAPFALTAGDLAGPLATRSYLGYGQVEGYGTGDQPTFKLTGSSSGWLELSHPGGIGARHATSSSGGYSQYYGSTGTTKAYLGGSGAGYLNLYNSAGQARANLGATTTGAGYGSIYGPGGQYNIRMTYTGVPDNGYLGVYATHGTPKVAAYASSDRDAGIVYTTGPNGNANVYLTTLSTHPNNGGISVADSAGTEQAGIYVNSSGNGIVWGDTKNFVVKHPTRAGHRIVYVSQEGPEASISFTGRVALVEGRAAIAVPEHFAALAAPDSVTVNLTPHSLTSKGLAVASIGRNQIVVGELFQGQGEYEVSYEIQGVRADKRDHRAVVTDAEFRTAYGVGGGGPAAAPAPEQDAGGIVEIQERP